MNQEIKKIYGFFGVFLLFTILHNLVSALAGMEEGVFFSAAFLVGILFIGSLIATVITFVRAGKGHDLWSLGWLGLVGIVGFLPNFGPGFFGLYGFFGFFGLKPEGADK